MKHMHLTSLLTAIVIVLVIFQAFSFYLIIQKSQESAQAINNTESRLVNTLTTNYADIQNKINTLSNAISTISSNQSSLQKQLSQVKASSADFSGIIQDDIKGVVTIKTDVAQGTGFLVSDNGYIVTNSHVLSGGSSIDAYTYDGNSHSATLIGYDSNLDIALLKISGTYDSLTLGDSNNVEVGAKVIAIGNPLGLSFTATEGIISAIDRTGINNLPYYFQTDVSLNPGNSGGPLIDKTGDVIGINNFKVSSAENIGFALESNYIKQTINSISTKKLNQTLLSY